MAALSPNNKTTTWNKESCLEKKKRTGMEELICKNSTICLSLFLLTTKKIKSSANFN
jgi:hypothetical protein